MSDFESAFGWYRTWADRAPGSLAVVTSEASVTYGDLEGRIEAEQDQLASEGFTRGDRFLHDDLPSTVEWIVMLLAALNLRLEVVIPDQDWPREDIPNHTGALLRERPPASAGSSPGGLWLFTSGTTSTPKPRFRSLPNLRSNVAGVQERLPAALRARRPTCLCLLPLSHGFGLTNALLLMHAIGGTVLISDLADRPRITALLQQHRVEIFYSWPAQLDALADEHLWARSKVPLAWCVSSSLRLSPETAFRFEAASGCPVRQQYGATETGPLSLDSGNPPQRDPSCVGTPISGVEVVILGTDGEALGENQEGELAVRLQHLHLPRNELRADGFWPTGDWGCQDEAGRIYVLRRLNGFTDERRFIISSLS